MTVQKRKGGSQIWTLSLEQNGESLKGVISSEGGDLNVTGTIKGTINLSFGKTVWSHGRISCNAERRHGDRDHACANGDAALDCKTNVSRRSLRYVFSPPRWTGTDLYNLRHKRHARIADATSNFPTPWGWKNQVGRLETAIAVAVWHFCP